MKLRSILGRSLRKKTPATPGFPEAAEARQIERVVNRLSGSAPLHTSHQKLSSWKRTGAYRLLVEAKNGKKISLVYKDADYSLENIPALRGLPALPGHPEYLIYSRGDGSLQRYLPRVHWHEEVSPRLHYRYLLEDLSLEYARSRDPQSLILFASKLPDLHRVLEAWHERHGRPGLLRYGKWFSLALQDYAREHLAAYAEWSEDPAAAELCRLWPEIRELHGSPPAFSGLAPQPIHGDFNPSNIWTGQAAELRIVDWEWAGLGIPHQDLAALLKRAPAGWEEKALAAYCREDRRLSPAEHGRLYEWCLLERALIDASFLAVQLMQGGWKTRLDQRSYVRASLESGLAAFRRLAGSRP